jgi:uncharacterized protein (DUF2141 family)
MKRCLAGSVLLLAALTLWLFNGRGPYDSHDRTQKAPSVKTDADRLTPKIRSSNSLVVRISGLRPHRSIRVALFDQPAGFPARRNAVRLLSAKSSGISDDVVIDGLMAGTYAIAVFQDLNEDGILNKGAFGVPNEPYGFSNNARGQFGPPSFEAAAFRCSHQNAVMEVALR